MISTKYNMLTIISEPYFKKYGKVNCSFVLCKCDCGNEKEILLSDLHRKNKNRVPKSCGCLLKEASKRNGIIHNLSRHILYKTWMGIKQRCYNSKNPDYKNYGGRGIVVDGWNNDVVQFYNDNIDKWKPGLTLERIDNDGNYNENNCRWATRKEQQNNKQTNLPPIKAFGEEKTIIRWTEDKRCKVQYKTLKHRIKRGWNPEKAISTLSKKYKHPSV